MALRKDVKQRHHAQNGLVGRRGSAAPQFALLDIGRPANVPVQDIDALGAAGGAAGVLQRRKASSGGGKEFQQRIGAPLSPLQAGV